jgi:mono/diheme cytochrome c family protein
MVRVVTPKRARLALGAIAFAAFAVPAVSALASAEEPPKSEPNALLTAEQADKGKQLFADWSCGACHTLAAADGAGSIGPKFDGNANLDHALAVDRITNGSGPMPSFGGQIPDADIDLLATYIVQVKK